MKLTVPSQFQLAGRTWTVKRVGKRRWYGQTHCEMCVIKLSARCKDDEELLHTFLHELVHAIAYTMGWTDLNDDEPKIDGVANLLMQALTTGE